MFGGDRSHQAVPAALAKSGRSRCLKVLAGGDVPQAGTGWLLTARRSRSGTEDHTLSLGPRGGRFHTISDTGDVRTNKTPEPSPSIREHDVGGPGRPRGTQTPPAGYGTVTSPGRASGHLRSVTSEFRVVAAL